MPRSRSPSPESHGPTLYSATQPTHHEECGGWLWACCWWARPQGGSPGPVPWHGDVEASMPMMASHGLSSPRRTTIAPWPSPGMPGPATHAKQDSPLEAPPPLPPFLPSHFGSAGSREGGA